MKVDRVCSTFAGSVDRQLACPTHGRPFRDTPVADLRKRLSSAQSLLPCEYYACGLKFRDSESNIVPARHYSIAGLTDEHVFLDITHQILSAEKKTPDFFIIFCAIKVSSSMYLMTIYIIESMRY